MRGTHVCYHHGGASPRGLASPHYRHGRYSRDLPARLVTNFQAALRDPHLLALRDEIALTDARLHDLLKRVDGGEAGHLWRQAQTAMQRFLDAQAENRTDLMRDALTQLHDLLAKGVADYAAWDEIARLIEQRRRLVESEQKRLVTMQQMLSTERAMLLLGVVVDVIRKHVTDRNTLAHISAEFRALLAQPAGGQAVAD